MDFYTDTDRMFVISENSLYKPAPKCKNKKRRRPRDVGKFSINKTGISEFTVETNEVSQQ